MIRTLAAGVALSIATFATPVLADEPTSIAERIRDSQAGTAGDRAAVYRGDATVPADFQRAIASRLSGSDQRRAADAAAGANPPVDLHAAVAAAVGSSPATRAAEPVRTVLVRR